MAIRTTPELLKGLRREFEIVGCVVPAFADREMYYDNYPLMCMYCISGLFRLILSLSTRVRFPTPHSVVFSTYENIDASRPIIEFRSLDTIISLKHARYQRSLKRN